MAKRLTKEEFIQKAKKVHGDKFDYSESNYKGMHDEITIICPTHGPFTQKAYTHLVSGCFKCSHIVPVDKEKFLTTSKSKHGDRYDYSKVNYIDRTTPVLIGCSEHGYFEQTPKLHMKGSGCKDCGFISGINKRKHNLEIFIQKAKKVHQDKYCYDKTIYLSDSEKLTITCKEHGDFLQVASSHLQGRGCPVCRYVYQKPRNPKQCVSKGENRILEILDELNLYYEYQYRISGFSFVYDFYLPKYNLIIEYDGKQHFSEHSWGGKDSLLFIQQRDNDKTNLANERGYEFIRISYLNFNTISKILRKKLSQISKDRLMAEANSTNKGQRDTQLVAYVDGSSRANPGYSGYGIFGYTLKQSKRPSKTKHPSRAKFNFTTFGFSVEKDTEAFETINILEHIGSINNSKGTNNLAEMVGFIRVLEFALTQDNLHLVKVITDSEYVVTNYRDNLDRWKNNGWKRADGKPIVHIEEWDRIDKLSNQLKNLGVTIDPTWVKGHDDDYGNETADLYASIGSNYARKQIESGVSNFNPVAYHSFASYKDFKDTLGDKDIIFYFRDIFFSSDTNINDNNYCFLTTNEDPNEIGKRNIASIFSINAGYVPPMITVIKEIFRSIPRNYVTSCCIRLSRIKDRELLRLMQLVGVEKLLHIVTNHTGTHLYLIKDTSPFVMEYTYDYPYVVEASKVFNASYEIGINGIHCDDTVSVDITESIIKDGKIAFNNKTAEIDLGVYFEKHYNLVHALQAKVGYDLPNFLALKSIEQDIQKVTAITELRNDSNYLSLFIVIQLKDRIFCSTNILNKYLIKR